MIKRTRVEELQRKRTPNFFEKNGGAGTRSIEIHHKYDKPSEIRRV